MHPASFNQLAKETRYSRGSFARKSSRQKTPTTESPPSVKQSRTTSNPERCSFVAFEPPKVSLPVDFHFLPHAASNAPSLVSRLTLRLSMSTDNRTSNQTLALKRKKMFIARVEWLPVTSRSHVTDGHHRQTNVRLVLGTHLVWISSLSLPLYIRAGTAIALLGVHCSSHSLRLQYIYSYTKINNIIHDYIDASFMTSCFCLPGAHVHLRNH